VEVVAVVAASVEEATVEVAALVVAVASAVAEVLVAVVEVLLVDNNDQFLELAKVLNTDLL